MPGYISCRGLEAIAARVIRAYMKLPEVRGTDLQCIDPTLLATELLGLKIEYRHLSADRMTLGLTCFDELEILLPGEKDNSFIFDGKTILIEKDLKYFFGQEGRRNFTITHEGGHHILKMLYPQDYASGVEARRVLYYRETNMSGCRREERQVNALTAAILMPEFLIRRGMKIVGLDGRIEILSREHNEREYNKFCDMAWLLGVSKQALSIRMKQLGLIGKAYLQYSCRAIDVMVDDDEDGDAYD